MCGSVELDAGAVGGRAGATPYEVRNTLGDGMQAQFWSLDDALIYCSLKEGARLGVRGRKSLALSYLGFHIWKSGEPIPDRHTVALALVARKQRLAREGGEA